MQPLISNPVSAFGAPQIGGKTPEEAAFLARLVAVQPSARQLSHSRLPYYSFIHFGMNTLTGREWGLGDEDLSLFHPDALDTDGWRQLLDCAVDCAQECAANSDNCVSADYATRAATRLRDTLAQHQESSTTPQP